MRVKNDFRDFSDYLEDTSNLKGHASALYIPETTEDLCQVLLECRSDHTPVTCTAGHTGTTGGSVAQGGVAVSLEKFKEIHCDSKNKRMRVASGVTLEQIENESNKHGLSFRASSTEPLAFVGGAIATNASGVRGFGYGSIRNYISHLDVVLTTGEILNIPRGAHKALGRRFNVVCSQKPVAFDLPAYQIPEIKTQAGYYVKDNMDLIDLFIGSEGTLGIILSAELLLQDMPASLYDGLVFFMHAYDALHFVNIVRQERNNGILKGIVSLEFFDSNSLSFLRPHYPFIPEDSSAIFFEQEIHANDDQRNLLEKWLGYFENSNALIDKSILAENKKERTLISEMRHALPQAINEFLRHHRQIKVASDCAVHWDNFSSMYRFYEDLEAHSAIKTLNFGHIGEGHLHYNFLPENIDQYRKAQELIHAICKKAVSLKGTVSAEHGIGKIKKPYLRHMFTDMQLKDMARVKKYFDPYCILNLDNIFDKELLEAVK